MSKFDVRRVFLVSSMEMTSAILCLVSGLVIRLLEEDGKVKSQVSLNIVRSCLRDLCIYLPMAKCYVAGSCS